MRIVDCHNDFLSKLNLSQIKNYVEYLEQCDIERLSCSFWTSDKFKSSIIDEIKDKWEIVKAVNCDRYLLHIEDLWFVDDFKKIIELNPFSCSLTWNRDNKFCGGCYGWAGLNKAGERIVRQMKENKILVDLAHLNKKSFYQVLDIVCDRPYVSHTSFDFVVKDKRNLDDDQIREIIARKGFIGLFFFDKLTNSKNHSAKGIAKIIAKFIEKFGDENLGLGSDYNGIEKTPKDLTGYQEFYKLESCLIDMGITKSQTENVFYKNFQNFINEQKNI